jgi:hypothetical protein
MHPSLVIVNHDSITQSLVDVSPQHIGFKGRPNVMEPYTAFHLLTIGYTGPFASTLESVPYLQLNRVAVVGKNMVMVDRPWQAFSLALRYWTRVY